MTSFKVISGFKKEAAPAPKAHSHAVASAKGRQPTAGPTRLVTEQAKMFDCLPDCAMYMGQKFSVFVKHQVLRQLIGYESNHQDCNRLLPGGLAIKWRLGQRKRLSVEDVKLLCFCIWDFPVSPQGQSCLKSAGVMESHRPCCRQ